MNLRHLCPIALLALLLHAPAPSTRAASSPADVDEIITPEIQAVIASSYYIIVDASPKKLLDDSGLSSPLRNGDPVPAVWPTHDTNLVNMYWSGSEHTPVILFQLPGLYDVRGLHYWNFNQAGAGADDHGGGGKSGGGGRTLSGGPERGVRAVGIYLSEQSATGPFVFAGTFEFAEASGSMDYRGDSLFLGDSFRARYVRFVVSTDWGGDFPGLSEVRFLGNPVPSLRIRQETAGLVLSWPSAASGYVLQEKAVVGSQDSWVTSALPSETSGGDRVARLAAGESARYFRLSHP